MKQHESLKNTALYRIMQRLSGYLDRYGLDALIGLLPWGIGDIAAVLFACVHLYFSAFKLKSLSLTLAILANALRDIALGMLPFFVGDVIDFFHRSNQQNMQLIEGFIEGDARTMRQVKRKAWLSVFIIITCILLIALLLYLLLWLGKTLAVFLCS